MDWNDRGPCHRAGDHAGQPGWDWHNADRVVTGPTWGGNLEILHWNLAANRWIQPVEAYTGCILLIETSEEMPAAHEVHRMLRNAGERGLLAQFAAVIVAKPKARNRERHLDDADRVRFRADQYDAVRRALADYNPTATVVTGPDFGHTDPQYVLPYGGQMIVDGPGRRIAATY